MNRAASILSKVNGQRVREGQPPYATIELYLADFLFLRLREFIRENEIIDSNSVRDAYNSASDATQAQVKTVLGI